MPDLVGNHADTFSHDVAKNKKEKLALFLIFLGSSKTDVFSRLKVLEERVLFLESLSPEYFKTGVSYTLELNDTV